MIGGERLARLATGLAVRVPVLWPLVRGRVARLFDTLAPEWDARRSSDAFASLEAAFAHVTPPPRRVLDLGTGTGSAAVLAARRWPDAVVVGLDLSERMIEEARAKLPDDMGGRVSFAVGDAAHLPYPAGAFELVVLANAIPFFDELARVVAPGGYVVFSSSRGSATPIFVPPERLRGELANRGFAAFVDVAAGTGSGLVARRSSGR